MNKIIYGDKVEVDIGGRWTKAYIGITAGSLVYQIEKKLNNMSFSSEAKIRLDNDLATITDKDKILRVKFDNMEKANNFNMNFCIGILSKKIHDETKGIVMGAVLTVRGKISIVQVEVVDRLRCYQVPKLPGDKPVYQLTLTKGVYYRSASQTLFLPLLAQLKFAKDEDCKTVVEKFNAAGMVHSSFLPTDVRTERNDLLEHHTAIVIDRKTNIHSLSILPRNQGTKTSSVLSCYDIQNKLIYAFVIQKPCKLFIEPIKESSMIISDSERALEVKFVDSETRDAWADYIGANVLDCEMYVWDKALSVRKEKLEADDISIIIRDNRGINVRSHQMYCSNSVFTSSPVHALKLLIEKALGISFKRQILSARGITLNESFVKLGAICQKLVFIVDLYESDEDLESLNKGLNRSIHNSKNGISSIDNIEDLQSLFDGPSTQFKVGELECELAALKDCLKLLLSSSSTE